MTRLIGRLEGEADKYFVLAAFASPLFNYGMLLFAPNPMFGAELTGFFASDIYYFSFTGIISLYAAATVVLAFLAKIRDPYAKFILGFFLFFVGSIINANFYAFFVLDSWKIQLFTVFITVWVLGKMYRLNKQVTHAHLTRNYTHFYKKEGDIYSYDWDGLEVLKDDIFQKNPYNTTFNISLLEIFIILLSYPVAIYFYMRAFTGEFNEDMGKFIAWGSCVTMFYIFRPILMDNVIHMRMITLIKKRLRLGQLPPPA